MTYRIAINGYGRIGQCVLRALYENNYRDQLQVVAINELADSETITYLTRYDTSHGRFPGQVSHVGNELNINDDHIQLLNSPNPQDIDWHAQEIDLLLECSGSFKERAIAEQHLQSGAPRLLFSQPALSDVDATIVYGLNEHSLQQDHRIVSNASCTTNCIVPVLKLLDQQWGISEGTITTIHSAMNDQPVIDAYHHRDLRLTRSALQSIIPVDTGLAKGIDRLLPELAGRFQALSMRVPTTNVSVIDLTVNLNTAVTEHQVNQLLKMAAESEQFRGILGYSEEPHASIDFNHDSRSGIIDGTQTRVSGNKMVKLMCWFDNEWGFANRMLDVAKHWLTL